MDYDKFSEEILLVLQSSFQMDGSQQWNGSFLELGYLNGRMGMDEILSLGYAIGSAMEVPFDWNIQMDTERARALEYGSRC